MEQHSLLDHLNEHHLLVLHYNYLPRINRMNRSLKEFVSSWNNHPIRTTGHKSPQQLFTAGALLLQHSSLSALAIFESVDTDYGNDPDGPVPVDEEDDNAITIPQTTLLFSDADYSLLQQRIDPNGQTDNYGIDLYEQTLILISTLRHYKVTVCIFKTFQ